MGNDFLENLSEFDLVIRGGSCTSGFAISSYFFSIKHTHSAVVYSQSHFATLEFLDIPDTRRTTSLYSFTSSVTASMCLERSIKMSLIDIIPLVETKICILTMTYYPI